MSRRAEGGAQHFLLLGLDSGFYQHRIRGFRLARDLLVLVIHDEDDVGRLVFKEAPVIAGGDDKWECGCNEEGREAGACDIVPRFPFLSDKVKAVHHG